MLCYADNGNSFRFVSDDYRTQPGEVVFRDVPTEEQLTQAFSVRETVNATRALKCSIAVLEASMHQYIYDRYNIELQMFLMGIGVAFIYAKITSQPDPCSQNRIAAILAVWTWHKSVTDHYAVLAQKLMDGYMLTPEEVDWPALFDATDPKISLNTLPE